MLDPRKFEEFKKFVADYQIVVKGELDAEYTRVAGLIAEWDKRNDHAKQVQQLKQDRANLYTEQTVFDQAREQSAAKLKDWEAKLKSREDELAAKIAAHLKAKDELRADQAGHATTSAAARAALDKREQAIAAKEKNLEGLQSALHDRDVDLAAKQDKVHRALATLHQAVA